MSNNKNDVQAKAFNQIINLTLSSTRPQAPQIWLVTSTKKGEGKTFIAVGLAKTLAARKKDLLLIDGNLRNPSINFRCNLENSPGLSELIEGDLNLNEVCRTYREKNCGDYSIRVITGGRYHTDPFEIFSSEKFKDLLNREKKNYDFLIVDSPSIESSVDPLLIAPLVDHVLLVVSAGKTRRSAFLDARDKIIRAKGNILGVILNKEKNHVPRILRRIFS
jgi:capsular exopolysaccharide synthesis family protein